MGAKTGTYHEEFNADFCTDALNKVDPKVVQNMRYVLNDMTVGDWATLLLASFVVAFSVYGEVKDILLCDFALAAFHEKHKENVTCSEHIYWRLMMQTLATLRLFCFLPFVLCSVILLVLFEGAEAKDICLNAVAVVFLLDLDNLAFSHGLNEETRMEAEKFGKVPMTSKNRLEEDITKWICVLTVQTLPFLSCQKNRTTPPFLIILH